MIHVQIQPKLIPDVANVPATNAAKVDLFRSLFRGRDDVFPRRWENEKKGKSGYSPACENEWEWGLCEKKKGPGAGKRATCGACPNQAFIAVSAEEIAKHLRGEQIMGVYPLLPDETCWFLAADFDKRSWQEDIAAFAETCRQHGVPVAIERSRSGNGAHAWFFFASPVSAVAARKLGCFLITETMARRHQLSMESYDRLFPNQDTMPKGGFGNLIALPLQREARDAGNPVLFTFTGTLTPLQEQAVKALLAHDTGVFVAPPGIGKTVVGTYLVAARKASTLILVHRKPLLDQWISQLALFLGIQPKDVGQIGAGKAKPNGRLDVAMVQSLVRKGSVSDLVAGYGQVIQDESHHCPAVSFERVLAEVKARYVVGLTATPQRRDGHHPILNMQLGPVRFAVDPKSQAARRPFEHKLFVQETGFSSSGMPEAAAIQELYAALAADPRRNDLIFDDVVRTLEEKRSPILLTERRDHLEHFAERLQSFTRHLVVLHGGMKPRERREVIARLAAIPAGEERLLIATGRYIGEGFDDARLDTLFLALPVSWKGTLIQYTGRLHRLHPGKTEVRIYDYVDRAVPMLMKMFGKRLRGYRVIGYARDEAPFGLREAEDEAVAKYDEDGLRDLEEQEP